VVVPAGASLVPAGTGPALAVHGTVLDCLRRSQPVPGRPGALAAPQVANPGMDRTVGSVRLSADGHVWLQGAAEQANLTVSTVNRLQTIDRLRVDAEGGAASLAQRLDRLERAVFLRSA